MKEQKRVLIIDEHVPKLANDLNSYLLQEASTKEIYLDSYTLRYRICQSLKPNKSYDLNVFVPSMERFTKRDLDFTILVLIILWFRMIKQIICWRGDLRLKGNSK